VTKPGPGKFQANESLEIAEDLYRQVQNGMVEEQFGSVDEGFWEGLLLDQLDTLNTPDLADRVPEGMQEAYIVTEDSDGFFTYRGFYSEADALSQFFKDMRESKNE
jgi:hypothetical protein